MSTATRTTESRVVLGDVDWETYQKLRDADGNRNLRMTYDQGSLEIMSPSKLHERVAELLARLVIIWTEEHDTTIQSCGSTTFKKEASRRALEPDKCFYIQNEAVVRGRDEVDLVIDPPPDLVIEVDVTASSESRMPIYADLGVPEIWCWHDSQLFVYVLSSAGQYELHRESTRLPGFPCTLAMQAIEQRHVDDENALCRRFRDEIRR